MGPGPGVALVEGFTMGNDRLYAAAYFDWISEINLGQFHLTVDLDHMITYYNPFCELDLHSENWIKQLAWFPVKGAPNPCDATPVWKKKLVGSLPMHCRLVGVATSP